MLIKTQDVSPITLWVIGEPNQRKLEKISRRTQSYSTNIARFESLFMVSCVLAGFILLVDAVRGSSAWIVVVSFVIWGIGLAVSRKVYEPNRAKCYLADCEADWEIFRASSAPFRLLVPVGNEQLMKDAKEVIDAALIQFARLCSLPEEAKELRGVHEVHWFLRHDCQAYWDKLRTDYLDAMSRQCGDEAARVLSVHINEAEYRLRNELAVTLWHHEEEQSRALRNAQRLLTLYGCPSKAR